MAAAPDFNKAAKITFRAFFHFKLTCRIRSICLPTLPTSTSATRHMETVNLSLSKCRSLTVMGLLLRTGIGHSTTNTTHQRSRMYFCEPSLDFQRDPLAVTRLLATSIRPPSLHCPTEQTLSKSSNRVNGQRMRASLFTTDIRYRPTLSGEMKLHL